MLENSGNTKTLLVGNRSVSDRVTGLNIGFDMLCEGFNEYQINHTILNRIQLGFSKKSGQFNIKYFFSTLIVLGSFLLKILTVNRVYLLVASSLLGFFRDAFMIWLSYFLGRKVILHLDGGGYKKFYETQSPLVQSFIRATVNKATLIVVLGELLKDQFYFVDDSDSKLRVIPNGLPFDLDDNLQPKQLPSSPDQPVRILYLSNLMESKGYLDVLKACALLKERTDINFHCDFCGNFVSINVDDASQGDLAIKDPKANFDTLIEQFFLNKNVTYHGLVKGEVKNEFLRKTHFFILPTFYPWEGQPVSIIEALAFGTPVISTPYRGIPDVVINDYTGFLVQPSAPEEIFQVLESIIKRPNDYHQLSIHSKEHYLKGFTRKIHTEALIKTILTA